MEHSDFIAEHRLTSADTGLSQQLCALRIFVRTIREATQKTSVDRCRPMQNDDSLKAPLYHGTFRLHRFASVDVCQC